MKFLIFIITCATLIRISSSSYVRFWRYPDTIKELEVARESYKIIFLHIYSVVTSGRNSTNCCVV